MTDTAPGEAHLLRVVLSAASAPADWGPQPGEEEVMAAFRSRYPTPSPRRKPVLRTAISTKLAAAGVAAGLALTGGGIAMADTGLPSTASDTAKAVLSKLGITVGGDAHTTAPTSGKAAKGTPQNTHGKQVSQLARTTTLTGRAKGAAVSRLASDGKSRAGQQSAAPTTSPTTGSVKGRETAATASGGHSTAHPAPTPAPTPSHP